MEKKEWISLVRETKQDKTYHMLRTCSTAWLVTNNKNLECLWGHYTNEEIKYWFTMKSLYDASLRILRSKQI